MNSYETQLKSLEDERDRFRRELQRSKRSSKERVKNSFFYLFGEMNQIKYSGCR